jgi:uncharacterized protein DUF1348
MTFHDPLLVPNITEFNFGGGWAAIVLKYRSMRFAYEWHDDSGHWYRSYGNEN